MEVATSTQARAGTPAAPDRERTGPISELRGRPELAIVVLLLLLTAAFGREFSRLDLGFGWLHPSEVLIGLALVVSIARSGVKASFARLRSTGVVIPLAIIWALGAIAAIRGLADFGFDLVLHEIGLVEYSLMIPVIALTVRDRNDLLFACRAVAIGGAIAIVVYAASVIGPWSGEVTETLHPIAVATGMVIALYATWVASRISTSGRIGPVGFLLLAAGVMMIIYGVARAAWVALLVGVILAVALGLSGRRLKAALIVGAAVAIGAVASLPLQQSPDVNNFGDPVDERASDDGGGNRGGGNRVSRSVLFSELDASFDGIASSQGANMSWRLDYWGRLLEDSVDAPLFGAGFGAPSDFEWRGTVYDSRDGGMNRYGVPDPYDITGPHNSFVAFVYRIGIPAFLALVAIVLIALVRLIRAISGATGEARRIAAWLLAGLAITSIVASFSVALEGPYMGIFFWSLLGLSLISPRLLTERGEP